jgi:hypothetical protein
MRVVKIKSFARFARKEGISDARLAAVIQEIENGLNVVDLGNGLIKKRVARAGEGKRGGCRTVIAYREGIRSVFLYGFSKNEKANLSDLELDGLKRLARIYLQLSEADIAKAIKAGEIMEVTYGKEKI